MKRTTFLILMALTIFVAVKLTESYKLNIEEKHLVKRAKIPIYFNRTKLAEAAALKSKLTTTTEETTTELITEELTTTELTTTRAKIPAEATGAAGRKPKPKLTKTTTEATTTELTTLEIETTTEEEEPTTECPPVSCCVCCYPPGCPNKPKENCNGKCAIPCKHVVCPQWV